MTSWIKKNDGDISIVSVYRSPPPNMITVHNQMERPTIPENPPNHMTSSLKNKVDLNETLSATVTNNSAKSPKATNQTRQSEYEQWMTNI
jgi:hypothetical protein